MGIGALDYKKGGSGLNINGIIEDYYVYAGENINAGDFVEFIEGIAGKKDFGTSIDTKIPLGATASQAAYAPVFAVELEANKIFIAHRNYAGGISGVIATIQNGHEISVGTSTVLCSNEYSGNSFTGELLSNGNIFIAHQYSKNYHLYGFIVTIAGETITAGTDTSILTSTSTGEYISTALLPNGNVFIAHSYGSSYYVYGIVCVINGTTFTSGTKTPIVSNKNSGKAISATTIANNRVFVSYKYGAQYNAAVVCGIDGTTISIGSEKSLGNLYGAYTNSTTLSENKVLVAYCSPSSYLIKARICTISNTTITTGTAVDLVTVGSGSTIPLLTISEDTVLFLHDTTVDDNCLYGMICKIDGTIITVGSDVQLNTSEYSGYYAHPVLLSDGNIFIAHSLNRSFYLYAQIWGIDETNNILTDEISAIEYETQVRPATSLPCNGVASTNGEGGDNSGHKDMVSIYTVQQTLASLPVGTLVKDTSSTFLGEPVIWKIADVNHEGYPSNSVTLITDKIVALRPFDGKEPDNSNSGRKLYGNNRYSVSNIRQWLNSDAEAGQWYSAQHSADALPNSDNVSVNPYDTKAGFLNGFSQEFKNALLETTLTAMLNTTADGGESEIVADKIFLPSDTEVGLENSITKGALLPIFSDNASRYAYCTTKALEDSEYENDPVDENTACSWRLRTPFTAGSSYDGSHISIVLSTTGALGYGYAYIGSVGIRPLCNIPSSIKVSKDEDGIYKLDF